ncbi:MAG: peroxiredoxin [Opitutaceae bacterium]
MPKDDGACAHLAGAEAPDIWLQTTSNRSINFGEEAAAPMVVFFYPRTGEPGKPSPPDWDMIPGARGCHHHFCGFRNIHQDFLRLGFKIFGASAQGTAYQQEFVQRMHIPFEVISDQEFRLTEALKLPTFEYHSTRLIARLVLVLNRRKIVHAFYPVFPPDKNAERVLAWIRAHRSAIT